MFCCLLLLTCSRTIKGDSFDAYDDDEVPSPAMAPSPKVPIVTPPPATPVDFAGQQVIIFGTSLSDDGNGEAPYIKGTLGTDKVTPNNIKSNTSTWAGIIINFSWIV